MNARDLFHEAAIRVAGDVCKRAIAAHDPEAARAAWARLTRLHGMRSQPVVEAMERARGLR